VSEILANFVLLHGFATHFYVPPPGFIRHKLCFDANVGSKALKNDGMD